MDPEACVEYYVACNPPLTARGVAFVVAAVENAFSSAASSNILEILYEPDIPWFKVISLRADKESISDNLRELLLSIVEEDADLVDLDQQQHQTPVDVNIVNEDSRVMPWSTYEAGFHEHDRYPDLFFPEFLRSLPQKKLWRGLETIDGWNINVFFKRFNDRWGYLGTPDLPQPLQKLLQCEISWNFKGTLLYISSELAPEAFEKAIQRLDNLRDLASHDWRSEHLIVTEGPGTFRFCFKYLTHVGQYRTTYLLERAPDGHDPLCKAVAISGESRDEEDQWNRIGPSTALKKSGMKPGSMKIFGPFKDYEYPRKEPSAVSDLFQSIVDAKESPQVEAAAPLPAVDILDLSGVESWRDAVQQAQSRETEEPSGPPSPLPSLIDLDAGTAPVGVSERDSDLLRNVFCGPQGALGVAGERSQQVDGFLESDDLICLGFDDLVCGDPTPQAHMSSDAQDVKPDLPNSLLDEDVPPLREDVAKSKQSRGASPARDALLQANGVPARSTQKSHLLKMTEGRVKGLAEILPLSPGLVSIELRFGRFYRKNLGANQINSGHGHGPYWDDASSMIKILGRDKKHDLGFSTALSACGPDLEEFVQMHPASEPAWQLCETEAWYEFVCTLNEDKESQMVVEIDAKTFEVRCRGLERELGCVYLHCVQRHWDMQVCVSRRAWLHNSRSHMTVAEALAASLASTTRDGRLYMETTEDAKLQATVDSASVRHVARYRQSRKTNSLLTVAMVRRLDKGERQGTRRKWHTSPPRSPFQGTPMMWYEASLSSVKGRDMFAENMDMRLGSKASYTCDQLEANGVFEDICRPGFSIVSQMDEIGLLNDNGFRMEAAQPHRTMIVEEKAAGSEVVYW